MDNDAEPIISTDAELRAVLNDLSFGPSCIDMGWAWEILWASQYSKVGVETRGWHLATTFRRPDRTTGAVSEGMGRPWWIARGATLSAVVKTAWCAVTTIVTHEELEAFKYKGLRVFDPHATVAELTGIARRGT